MGIGKVVVSEQFRTPSSLERSVGIWLDRMGAGPSELKDDEPPPHRKLGLFATVCVTNGNGIFHSEPSGTIEVGEGDVILLFPDVPSRYHPYKRWETEWIVWGGDEAAILVSAGLLEPRRPVARACGHVVTRTRSKLIEIIGDESPANVLERKVMLLEMLLELHRPLKKRISAVDSNVERAVAFIERKLDRDMSVGDVSSHCGYSETHFRRLFKLGTGMSPKEFIIAKRISKAKEFLSAGLTVKETAELTGFKNEFYFRNTFKKVTRQTPASFNKSLMADTPRRKG